MTPLARFLVHGRKYRYRVVDTEDVYLVEADRDETLVRLRSKKRLRDVRSLGEIVPLLEPHAFVRISRSVAVNLLQVRELRRRDASRGWELKMRPPVNRVLPVAEDHVDALMMRLRGEA